ncbi:uncharacterized protein LOC126106293 [Schistocerca cancellata]|uniref:uncharacterized protein LOC126106293 n=1 Tax=Schistocerca cancellata TaxID=274614 RepID=UPI0021189B89|nr:uncharacterized protein LOC126106293 [Schistocerca cancellata]
MAVLNQCCCGCSLKTGTIIIAVLYVIASLVQIATTANSLHTHQYVDEDLNYAIDNFNSLVHTDIEKQLRDTAEKLDNDFGLKGSDGSLTRTVNKALPYKTKVTKTQLIVTLVFAIIQAICGILLLFGAIQEKAGMLLPWVVVETLVVIASTVVGIITCIALIAVAETATAGFIAVVFVVLYVLLSVYFLLVVYSYYQTLRENPRRYV